MTRFFTKLYSCSLIFFLLPNIATSLPWQTNYTFYPNFGRNNFALIDLMYPFAGDASQLWYVDGRADSSSLLGNGFSVGAGFRRLNNQEKILGFYLFNDSSHTQAGSPFQQLTLGAEKLSMDWDYRANIFLPYGDKRQRVGDSYLTLDQITGHKIWLQLDTNKEVAEPGASIEIGRALNGLSKPLRIYAGYYHYGFSNAQTQVDGGEMRLEYRYNNKTKFIASEQYDHVWGNQFGLGAQISFGGSTHGNSMNDRMMEFVPHSPQAFTSKALDTEPAFASSQNVYFVNSNSSNNGGDGTYEDPYDSVQQALAAAGNDNIVYVYSGNYNLAGQATIGSGTLLTGAGGNFIYQGVDVIPGSQAPVLTGGLVASNNSSISNLNLQAGDSGQTAGIIVNNVSNVSIDNVAVSGFTTGSDSDPRAYGLKATNANNLTISNSSFNNNQIGLGISDSNNINVSNSSANQNSLYGMALAFSNHATINNVTTDNNFAGFYLQNSNNINVDYLTASANHYGAYVIGNDQTTHVIFNDSNFNNNSQYGFYAQGTSSAFTINNSSLNNNYINAYVEDGSTLTINNSAILNNTSNYAVVSNNAYLILNNLTDANGIAYNAAGSSGQNITINNDVVVTPGSSFNLASLETDL